jgi:hypothetical protein
MEFEELAQFFSRLDALFSQNDIDVLKIECWDMQRGKDFLCVAAGRDGAWGHG